MIERFKIPIITAPEEDEYIYSYICRLSKLNGFDSVNDFIYSFIADNIYNDPKDIKHIMKSYNGNIYLGKFFDNLNLKQNPVKLYQSLSTYPCLSIAMPAYRQLIHINYIFRSRERFQDFINDSNAMDSKLLYCPECEKEQMKSKGYFWFLRKHQRQLQG